MWQNDQYLNSPYVAVFHRKTTESQPWTTPSVTIVKNSYVQNRLRMLTVLKSEVETSNRTHKVMDGSPLTRKGINERQTVIQGQGRFPKCGLPWVILPECECGFMFLVSAKFHLYNDDKRQLSVSVDHILELCTNKFWSLLLTFYLPGINLQVG